MYFDICHIYALPCIKIVPLVLTPLPFAVDVLIVYQIYKGFIYFILKMQNNTSGDASGGQSLHVYIDQLSELENFLQSNLTALEVRLRLDMRLKW